MLVKNIFRGIISDYDLRVIADKDIVHQKFSFDNETHNGSTFINFSDKLLTMQSHVVDLFCCKEEIRKK